MAQKHIKPGCTKWIPEVFTFSNPKKRGGGGDNEKKSGNLFTQKMSEQERVNPSLKTKTGSSLHSSNQKSTNHHDSPGAVSNASTKTKTKIIHLGINNLTTKKSEKIKKLPQVQCWARIKKENGGETASNKMPLNSSSFELPVAWRATCRV